MTACVTNTDLHALLAARREIAVVWCVEDVLEVRPDLSEDSSWAVLQACKSCHDANIGISWDVLRVIADELFPSGGPGE